MSLSYEQNFLIDCSQSKSESSTKTSWLNTLPETITLNAGDTVQIYSSYINKRGSDANSIEITGFNKKNNVRDSEVQLTFGFYKNATGDGVIPMPYNFFLSSVQKNAIVLRDGYAEAARNVTDSEGVDAWEEWSMDRGQRFCGKSNDFQVDATFAYCTDRDITSPTLSRLGSTRYGNPSEQAVYDSVSSDNNVFKTYLCDITQPLDGSRCTALFFDKSTNKYKKVESLCRIQIEPGSYSPGNLANLISNYFNLPPIDDDKSQPIDKKFDDILNEDLGTSGYYIGTPTCVSERCLYMSRSKIKQQSVSPQDPYPSPIVKYTNVEGTSGRVYQFNPKQDKYLNLKKENITDPVGNAEAYNWVMNYDDDEDGALVYYKYPETLIAGQELATGYALSEDVIDFNHDVKLIGDATLNPSSYLPTIADYCYEKGDYDKYLLTGLKWTSENLLKVKKFFDNQLIEDNVQDAYCYDWTGFSTGNNPTSRNQSDTNPTSNNIGTIQGDKRIHRWIHIGQRNNIPTNTSVNQITKGGTAQLFFNGTTTPVYGEYTTEKFKLRSFSSDYLGNDGNVNGSTNTEFTFTNSTAGGSVTANTYMGNPELHKTSATSYNKVETYSYTLPTTDDDAVGSLIGKLNGTYDVDCENIKYCGHHQLINVRSDVDIFPTPENQESENKGFGYCYKYTANPLSRADFPKGDFIMLKVNENTGGLQRNVLEFNSSFSVGDVLQTQALFWIPCFSSGICNQAIMPIVGQGSQLSKTTTVDPNSGDADLTTYNKSIIECGVGAVGGGILDFSDEVSRFEFNNLYTPIYASNYYAFNDITPDHGTKQVANPNAGKEILSFNVNNLFYKKVDTGETVKELTDIGTLVPSVKTFTDAYKFLIPNAFTKIFPYNYRSNFDYVLSNADTYIYYQQGGVFIDKWVEQFPDGLNEDNIKGTWSSSDVYLLYDIVVYKNIYYESLTQPNINFPPDTNPDEWKKINIILETEENFNNSLWFKLGFSYNQTHLNKIQADLDITEATDTSVSSFRNSHTINRDGSVGHQNYYSMPITNNTNLLDSSFNNLLYVNPFNYNLFMNQPSNDVNTLQIISQSTNFIAEDLPVRSEDPYFIIESNILSISGLSQNYFSQNAIMSGIDICEKSFNSSDFYMYNGNLVHQISKSYDINSVTHQIRRSNGRLLDTNQFSSVIYLATKKIIVGLPPEQMELLEEEREQRQKNFNNRRKQVQELNKPNLNKKQQILKNLLEANQLQKDHFHLEDNNDSDDDDELNIEDEMNEEADDNEEAEDQNEITVTIGRYQGQGVLDDEEEEEIQPSLIEEMFSNLELEDTDTINLQQIQNKMIMDEQIDKSRPLFKSTSKSKQVLKQKLLNPDNIEPMDIKPIKQTKQTEQTEFIDFPILQTPKLQFPTFSDIGKQTSKKKNLGRPTRYSQKRSQQEQPITEDQLQNLKERLTQRARSIRPSTQSKLKSVSLRDITEQKE